MRVPTAFWRANYSSSEHGWLHPPMCVRMLCSCVVLCHRSVRAYNQYCPYFCVAYSSSLPYLNRGPSSHLVVVRNRGADGSYTLYHTKGADYRVGCTRSTIQSTLVRGLIGAEQNTKQRENLDFASQTLVSLERIFLLRCPVELHRTTSRKIHADRHIARFG